MCIGVFSTSCCFTSESQASFPKVSDFDRSPVRWSVRATFMSSWHGTITCHRNDFHRFKNLPFCLACRRRGLTQFQHPHSAMRERPLQGDRVEFSSVPIESFNLLWCSETHPYKKSDILVITAAIVFRDFPIVARPEILGGAHGDVEYRFTETGSSKGRGVSCVDDDESRPCGYICHLVFSSVREFCSLFS